MMIRNTPNDNMRLLVMIHFFLEGIESFSTNQHIIILIADISFIYTHYAFDVSDNK